MSLPKKLKDFNLFVDGGSFAGVVTEATLPKLTRKTEDYRGGGMPGSVKVGGLGYEALQLQWKVAGFDRRLFTQWKAEGASGVLLRFAGALQDDNTGAISAAEVIMRGFHSELDRGTSKSGDKTEFSITSELSYYKETLDGTTVIELDMVNMIEVIDGVDLGAAVRKAIGL